MGALLDAKVMMRMAFASFSFERSKCCRRKQEENTEIQKVFARSLAVVDLRIGRSDVCGAFPKSEAGIHSRPSVIALACNKLIIERPCQYKASS